jgi:hypothetical protein
MAAFTNLQSALLEGFRAEAVLADRAYDNNDLR